MNRVKKLKKMATTDLFEDHTRDAERVSGPVVEATAPTESPDVAPDSQEPGDGAAVTAENAAAEAAGASGAAMGDIQPVGETTREAAVPPVADGAATPESAGVTSGATQPTEDAAVTTGADALAATSAEVDAVLAPGGDGPHEPADPTAIIDDADAVAAQFGAPATVAGEPTTVKPPNPHARADLQIEQAAGSAAEAPESSPAQQIELARAGDNLGDSVGTSGLAEDAEHGSGGSDHDLDELPALIAEPIPGRDVERAQRELFIKRQYRGEQTIKTLNALFQIRMGIVLLGLKAQVGHGKWEAYVASTFPFSRRSAVEFMDLGREIDEEDASKYSPYDLRVKLGKSKQGNVEVGQTLEGAVETLKKIWQQVLKLGAVDSPLRKSLRRLQRPDPDVETLLKLTDELSISLTSLAADLRQQQQAAAEWAQKHPGLPDASEDRG